MMSDEGAVNIELMKAEQTIYKIVAAAMLIDPQVADEFCRAAVEGGMGEGVVAIANAFNRFRYELERAKREEESLPRRTGTEPVGFPPVTEYERQQLAMIRAKMGSLELRRPFVYPLPNEPEPFMDEWPAEDDHEAV